MYKKYLGITVPNDATGYLQDTHWATGLVGYFSSYALGSAYSAQMFDTMLKDIDIWPAVRLCHRDGPLDTSSHLLIYSHQEMGG